MIVSLLRPSQNIGLAAAIPITWSREPERMRVYLPYWKIKPLAFCQQKTSMVIRTWLIPCWKAVSGWWRYSGGTWLPRRTANAGACWIINWQKNRIPVISLYGDHKKIKHLTWEDIDVLLFDIRMLACAIILIYPPYNISWKRRLENHKPLMILTGPNPNGFMLMDLSTFCSWFPKVLSACNPYLWYTVWRLVNMPWCWPAKTAYQMRPAPHQCLQCNHYTYCWYTPFMTGCQCKITITIQNMYYL